MSEELIEEYRQRQSMRFVDRLERALEPPEPLVRNPREPLDFPLGKWNLYIGGAGRTVAGYVNLDLFPVPGVDVAAEQCVPERVALSAQALPFAD